MNKHEEGNLILIILTPKLSQLIKTGISFYCTSKVRCTHFYCCSKPYCGQKYWGLDIYGLGFEPPTLPCTDFSYALYSFDCHHTTKCANASLFNEDNDNTTIISSQSTWSIRFIAAMEMGILHLKGAIKVSIRDQFWQMTCQNYSELMSFFMIFLHIWTMINSHLRLIFIRL